jgi:EF hand
LILGEVDENGDGVISFEEFVEMIFRLFGIEKPQKSALSKESRVFSKNMIGSNGLSSYATGHIQKSSFKPQVSGTIAVSQIPIGGLPAVLNSNNGTKEALGNKIDP